MNININATSIETCLWHIQRSIMEKCGCDKAERAMYPLKWYVQTGRASVDFLRALLEAKPFMVGRTLVKGGSDQEVIAAVKKRIGYQEAAV